MAEGKVRKVQVTEGVDMPLLVLRGQDPCAETGKKPLGVTASPDCQTA